MAVKLGPSSLPLLSPDAVFQRSGGDLAVDTAAMTYTFHGDSAAVLARVQDRLDGSASVEELARLQGISPNVLAEVLDVLAEDGQVLDARATIEASTPDAFLSGFMQICAFWARELTMVPFWPTLISGRAPRELVLGWGIEFYHYVEAANEHMSASVAYCRTDPEAQEWFAQHYAEEYDHSKMFLEGLVGCGLDADQVRRSPPLGSTRALINYLTELATTDSLAYAGAYGVLHHPQAEASKPQELYGRLAEQYAFAAPFLRAVGEHAALDETLDHETLVVERILRRDGRVTPDAAKRILAGARGLTEHFTFYFDGIYDTYAGPEAASALLPRRPLDARLFTR
jgi:pyrroloquinoline quinone (PQQ) biosynthesis protein C